MIVDPVAREVTHLMSSTKTQAPVAPAVWRARVAMPRAKSPATRGNRPDRRRPGGRQGWKAWRAGGRREERLAEEEAGERGDLGGGQADRGGDGHLGGQRYRLARLGGEGCPGGAFGGVPGADDQDPGDAGQERAAEVRVVGLRCRSG